MNILLIWMKPIGQSHFGMCLLRSLDSMQKWPNNERWTPRRGHYLPPRNLGPPLRTLQRSMSKESVCFFGPRLLRLLCVNMIPCSLLWKWSILAVQTWDLVTPMLKDWDLVRPNFVSLATKVCITVFHHPPALKCMVRGWSGVQQNKKRAAWRCRDPTLKEHLLTKMKIETCTPQNEHLSLSLVLWRTSTATPLDLGSTPDAPRVALPRVASAPGVASGIDIRAAAGRRGRVSPVPRPRPHSPSKTARCGTGFSHVFFAGKNNKVEEESHNYMHLSLFHHI